MLSMSAALARALTIDPYEGWQRGGTVANGVIFFLAMLAGSVVLDGLVRPRASGFRQWQGLTLLVLLVTALFGVMLAVSGSALLAATLTVAFMGLLTIASNAKYAMLGEPLLFSDLALIAALFRHPRFYLTAVSAAQRWMFMIAAPLFLLALAALFAPRAAPHLIGLAVFATSVAALVLLVSGRPFRSVALIPDIESDLARHGLPATLLIYWLRWRVTRDPGMCPEPVSARAGEPSASAMQPEIIVIVQCESFADPVALTGEHRHALPGLLQAQASAWQWGDLAVSGFGAYTMRTEYGVLFGRSEEALGFRRYDPFLTARGETSYALPARLRPRGYHNLFVHPHDMRFYGRDRLMPAIGFDRLIGEDGIAPLPSRTGRYVDDRTLGAAMATLIDEAVGPTLIYAVTMENHGPWDRDVPTGSLGGVDDYLRHLGNSDAMLTSLTDRLSSCGRSALLVFFGDHRPSIPGVTEPTGGRHTPYVMMRFADDGHIVAGDNRRADLSPDELHHAVLACVGESLLPDTAMAGDRKTATR